MKFYGGVWGGKRNKGLNFGSHLDHHADFRIENLDITQQIMTGFWRNLKNSSAID